MHTNQLLPYSVCAYCWLAGYLGVDIAVWKPCAVFPIPNVERSEPSVHCTLYIRSRSLIGHRNTLNWGSSRVEQREWTSTRPGFLYCGGPAHALNGGDDRYTDRSGTRCLSAESRGWHDTTGLGLWAVGLKQEAGSGKSQKFFSFRASQPNRAGTAASKSQNVFTFSRVW